MSRIRTVFYLGATAGRDLGHFPCSEQTNPPKLRPGCQVSNNNTLTEPYFDTDESTNLFFVFMSF